MRGAIGENTVDLQVTAVSEPDSEVARRTRLENGCGVREAGGLGTAQSASVFYGGDPRRSSSMPDLHSAPVLAGGGRDVLGDQAHDR